MAKTILGGVNSDDHRFNLVPTHTIPKKRLHVVKGHKKKNNSLSFFVHKLLMKKIPREWRNTILRIRRTDVKIYTRRCCFFGHVKDHIHSLLSVHIQKKKIITNVMIYIFWLEHQQDVSVPGPGYM